MLLLLIQVQTYSPISKIFVHIKLQRKRLSVALTWTDTLKCGHLANRSYNLPLYFPLHKLIFWSLLSLQRHVLMSLSIKWQTPGLTNIFWQAGIAWPWDPTWNLDSKIPQCYFLLSVEDLLFQTMMFVSHMYPNLKHLWITKQEGIYTYTKPPPPHTHTCTHTHKYIHTYNRSYRY